MRRPISISTNEEELSIVSSNVRLLTLSDQGSRCWFYRASLLLCDIAAQSPGVIGFQEVTPTQYRYLKSVLSGYDSIITYRDNEKNSEGCPVFFSTALYTLQDKGSFWLSETPEVMSRDWGSCCYRICSYAILKEKKSGKEFVVFNAHLDHVSEEARIKGVGVVLSKIAAFGSLPAVLMGDFNAEEDSQTYRAVTENFLDARHAAKETMPGVTYQNWGNYENGQLIDYFMLSKNSFDVKRFRVVSVEHDGAYASDHCPIAVKLKFK